MQNDTDEDLAAVERAEAWKRAKNALATIQAADPRPTHLAQRPEWVARCQRRSRMIERFIQDFEEERFA